MDTNLGYTDFNRGSGAFLDSGTTLFYASDVIIS
jgi:hypothetical protein